MKFCTTLRHLQDYIYHNHIKNIHFQDSDSKTKYDKNLIFAKLSLNSTQIKAEVSFISIWSSNPPTHPHLQEKYRTSIFWAIKTHIKPYEFLPSSASTQLNSTSVSIEAEIALFPVSDKPPTHPPTRRSSDLELCLNSFSARVLQFGTDTHYTNLIKIYILLSQT